MTRELHDRVDELALKLIDGEISDRETEELSRLTMAPAERARLVRLLQLEAFLQPCPTSIADQVIDRFARERRRRVADGVMKRVAMLPEPVRTPVNRHGNDRARRAIYGGGIALAACLILAILWKGAFRSTEVAIAQLNVNDAHVQLLDADGMARPLNHARTLTIHAGDTIVTSQAIDPVGVKYEDGTTIDLLGDSRVSFRQRSEGSKQLRVLSGFLQANVTPQPAGRPLQILTSTATLDVLGTTLGVEVRDERTQVEVIAGRVAMTRNVDGKRVEVEAGRLATATHRIDGQMTPRPFPSLPDAWSQDFSHGLPNGWLAGELMSTDHGNAVRAAGDGHGNESNIAVTTQNAWHEGQHGLFSLHPDSVLNIRFRQSHVAPLRVMLVTRQYPPKPIEHGERARGTNLYYENSNWNAHLAPHQWHTISIPLGQPSYHGKRKSFSHDALDVSGLAAFMLQVSSLDQEIGLTVEQIWVTRQTAGNEHGSAR